MNYVHIVTQVGNSLLLTYHFTFYFHSPNLNHANQFPSFELHKHAYIFRPILFHFKVGDKILLFFRLLPLSFYMNIITSNFNYFLYIFRISPISVNKCIPLSGAPPRGEFLQLNGNKFSVTHSCYIDEILNSLF
jgi:hypothetical protein